MLKCLFVVNCLLFHIVFNPLFAQNASSSGQPNIVYILADDLGYGDISFFNENSKLHTPAIDELAKGGVAFTDAHTSSSVCTPTRYSILTGRYNWRSTLKKSVLSGYSKALIEPERMTVADLLQQHGYHTSFVGKWHLGWDWSFKHEADDINSYNLNNNPEVDFTQPITNGPNAQGFDYSFGFNGSLDMPPYVYIENANATSSIIDTTQNVDTKGFWRKGPTAQDFNHTLTLDDLTEKAVAYISEQAKQPAPFFMYFALPAPHTPILPTTEFLGKSNTNFYGDFVLQVDDVVRRVVEALEKQGVRENTMIIFTSDNGCSPKADFGELAKVGHDPSYIYRGHKADIYEGGHRVPFIVNWTGGIKNPLVSDEVICTTDLMATCADILDTDLPDDAAEDSYSFLPVLQQKSYTKPLREATVHHSIEGRFAIRKDEWKLILWPGSGGWSAPKSGEALEGLEPMQLYNLAEDPAEQENLYHKHPEVVKSLTALLNDYIKKGRSTPGKEQRNDGPAVWEELDWMGAENSNE
ncbi:arylsulfatase A [Catalinimonas alkaloidigena]|uniref:sulfatase family protein n=1 Tax=Catalinimonas alkaloidigena TaxID=1075417 RepID=UPI002405E267|nr:arylsulfatase [Catalinimonas alkaloidigena]MDF9799324.1 arylsulfatase A [Catalinimonas alkaloidigena]